MDTIKLSIVTPTGSIFNGDVKTVTLPGKEGEFGVLPGHSSLVSTLSVGVIVIEKISFEAVPFEHCVKSESGENFDWLVVKISKDLFSFAINRFNALFL